MTKRRSNIELKITLIQNINKHPQKAISRIIYGEGINYVVGQKLLDFLVQKGLLSVTSNSKRKKYLLTEEGRVVLSLWKQLRERLEP